MTKWQQQLTNRIEAARGDRPVDLLFRGGRVVNVFTGELTSNSIAVFDGVVVGFDDRQAKEVVELKGAILSPGFIDGARRICSSSTSPWNHDGGG